MSHEAASLAGHLGIGRLVYIYDDNHITIDGPTELSYSDDVPKRFAGYGWHVVELGEVANDLDAIEGGIRAGMAEAERPSIVILRSHIGYPSPKYTDTAYAHGNALGADEVAATKEILGLPARRLLRHPTTCLAYYREAGARGRADRARLGAVAASRSRSASRVSTKSSTRASSSAGSTAGRRSSPRGTRATRSRRVARRARSSKRSSTSCPPLVAGGADLSGNTGTLLEGAPVIAKHLFGGRQLHFGIREHGMGAIMNGMAVSGLLPAGGTFFVFSDYMRPAVRLAALSRYKTAFVWSHDSVGVGEDGPTHQPIEHLASLRAMPELNVIRPADANEAAQAWRLHIDGERPHRDRPRPPERARARGHRGALARRRCPRRVRARRRSRRRLDLVLIGTGSEVSLCVDARELLAADGLSVRVVSMPSWELFAAQDDAYRDSVLPPGVPTLAVEAGASFGWERYADDVVAIDHFGASAPGGTSHDGVRLHSPRTLPRARARAAPNTGGTR